MILRRPSRAAVRRALPAVAVPAAVLVASVTGGLVVADPAAAGSLLSIRAFPPAVRGDDVVTVEGVSGPPQDEYVTHGASLFVLRPGVKCPPAPPADDALDVLGSYSGWTFSADDQPDPVKVLLQRPSPVGAAQVCSYVRPWTIGGAGDPTPGPTTNVPIAANLRAWSAHVGVISAVLRHRAGRVPVRIGCSTAHGPCGGSVALRVQGTIVGRAPFQVPAGHDRSVVVPLDAAGRRIVARRGRHVATTELRPARGIRLIRRVPLRR